MANIDWNRHRATCTGFSATGTRCSKCQGSRNIAQRNMFAALVNVALMGDTGIEGVYRCPIARNIDGTPVLFTLDTGDVDRPRTGDYEPGNVCYVSSVGNARRSRLQSAGEDMDGAAAYAADVLRVSLAVDVPDVPTAVRWWKGRPVPADVLIGYGG